MFHYHFPFFNKRNISTLISLFLGKMFKLVIMITSLSVGVLLSPVSKMEAVKQHTRGRQTTPRRYLYTNEICK